MEIDPRLLLGSVIDAGRQAIAAAGEPVVAIGLANQGETVLAWDPATGALTAAIGWQDRRAAIQQLALDAPNAAIVSYPFVLVPAQLTRAHCLTPSDD